MLGLEMLDVAIGVVFVFLLLSLICSAVNEIIESMLKLRASDLERGIKELLEKSGATHYKDIIEKLYNHPLISNLYEGEDYQTAKKKRNLPSYIPSRNFALALLDIVTPADMEAPDGTVNPNLADNKKATPAAQGGNAPVVNQPPINDSSTYKAHTLNTVRETISKIENDKIKRGLMPLLDTAENDVNRLRASIEDWYNSTMDRVSGWYKRRVQWITLSLGLAVAITVNADTISIVNSLTHDPAARDSLITASQEYAKAEANATGNKDKGAEESAQAKLTDNLSRIKSLGLPIGWGSSNPQRFPDYVPNNLLKPIIDWLLKILGWLITAAAISLGAPFWFDVLNKFMVVRSTVKPKEKSKEEGQKDARK